MIQSQTSRVLSERLSLGCRNTQKSVCVCNSATTCCCHYLVPKSLKRFTNIAAPMAAVNRYRVNIFSYPLKAQSSLTRRDVRY
jgi:hypothetical protein